MKTYYPEVDIVKGVAILMVILGHSFCVYPIDLVESLGDVQSIIYSFHMPLFFIASGFVYSRTKTLRELMQKKFYRLFLPWIAFSVLSVALRVIFSSVTHGGKIDVGTACVDIVQGKYYWFLYSLMCLLMICNAIRRTGFLVGISLISVVLGLFDDIKEFDFFTLGRTVYYLPFFVFGFLFRKHYGGAISCMQKLKGYVLMTIMVVCYVGLMLIKDSFGALYRYPIPLIGSMVVWGVAFFFKSKSMLLLKHFGKYSLQYYLNHLLILLPIYFLASKMPNCPWLQLMTIWMLGTLVSWLMLLIQKRVRFFRLICGIK